MQADRLPCLCGCGKFPKKVCSKYMSGHNKKSVRTLIKLSQSLKGRTLSTTHRKNISKGMKGIKRSAETKAKMSRAKKGQPSWHLGKKRSQETRAKLAKAQTGKRYSAESRTKMSLSKIRAICEGRFHPERHGIGGKFYSRKNKKTLHYRSQLELHWYQILETLEKVLRYYVEPIVIPYEWEGAIHHYLPDLRVRYTDGTTELVEIKPEDEWSLPQNLAKFKAARAWCEKRNVPTIFKLVGYGDKEHKDA